MIPLKRLFSARHPLAGRSLLAMAFSFWASHALAADVSLGMNYRWFQFDPSKMTQCDTHPATTLFNDGIISSYSSPDVRREVQRQLEAMRHAGFSIIRTFVTIRPPPARDRADGPLTLVDGQISDRDQGSIKLFVQDIAAARFKTLEIVYGVNGLYCKKQKWGDCYKPEDTQQEWQFTEQATRLVLGAAGSQLALRFDLGNEGCPAGNMPAETLQNAQQHFALIAGRFQKEFGQNWLVSCGNSQKAQRLKLMLQMLKTAGLQPRYLEVHSYRTDPKDFEGQLTAANTMAAAIGAKLILGEMRYHSNEQASMLGDWLKSTPNSQLIEAIQWPRQSNSRCAVDTPPPYTPGPLGSVLRNN